MKAVLTDIMGTTSPTSYLKLLRNNFKEHGHGFIQRADTKTLELVDKIKQESCGLKICEEVVVYVLDQISKRNLKPEYLALLGMVNVEGYQTGRLKGDFFNDVPEAFAGWRKNDKGIYVYSNGSERSQREMFRTAQQGDLAVLVDGFFDTAEFGSKHIPDSYRKISDKVGIGTLDILYLSDFLEELDAADKAGCHVCLVVRPGNKPVSEHCYDVVTNFLDIKLEKVYKHR